MKKLIIILSLFISVATYSQGVKISAMPTLTDPALIQGGYVPIVSNLINYKFQPNLFALSSTTITINGETHDISEDRSWTITGSATRFGVSGEDDQAAETRDFDQNSNPLVIHGGVFRHGTGDYNTQTALFSEVYSSSSSWYTVISDGSGDHFSSISNLYDATDPLIYLQSAKEPFINSEIQIYGSRLNIKNTQGEIYLTTLDNTVTSNVVYIDNDGKLTYGAAPSGGGGGIQSIEGTNGTVVVNDSIVKLGTNPLIENTVINGAGSFYLRFTDTRMQEDLGASIAAANDLTLGADGNSFSITGATQINAITSTNWQAGSVVRLIFASTPIVKHNTTGGAGTAKILLSGGVDFTATADDVLTLVYDGTTWHETGRKLSSTAVGFTRFGVSGEDATQAQTRAFSMGSNTFTINQNHTSSASTFTIANSGSGAAFGVTNNGGNVTATFQNSSNGVATNIISGTGVALTTSTTGTTASARFDINPSSTNTTQNVVIIRRQTSGTAANNIAAGLEIDVEASDGNTYLATRFVPTFTNATAASRVSSLFVELTDNAVNANKVEFTGGGNVKLLTAGKGLALTSPDGTVYYGTISNAGVLSWSTSVP